MTVFIIGVLLGWGIRQAIHHADSENFWEGYENGYVKGREEWML